MKAKPSDKITLAIEQELVEVEAEIDHALADWLRCEGPRSNAGRVRFAKLKARKDAIEARLAARLARAEADAAGKRWLRAV